MRTNIMTGGVFLLEMGFLESGRVKEYLNRNPTAREEIEHNLATYGVPFLVATSGPYARSEITDRIRELLDSTLKGKPARVEIYPSEPEPEAFVLQYSILRIAEGGGFHRAIEYEARLRGIGDEDE